MSSYTGVSGLSGVNTFGGGNSFSGPSTLGGTSSMLADPNTRNIQASQIQDTGLRSLLQDQFKPANRYSKLGVAPINQINAAAQQYQSIDQSQLGDETKSFLQPYLTGKTSSLNPTQAFITRDKLAEAQAAMNARNVPRATQPTQPTRNPLQEQYQSHLGTLSSIAKAQQQHGRGATPYETRMKGWTKLAQAGFIPGMQAPEGWTYQPGRSSNVGKGSSGPEEGAGLWYKDNYNIGYSPTKGYSTATNMSSSDAWRDDLSSIMTVLSVIGGVVLPGLGTSWGALAGDALGSAGVPASSLSTASLGVPAGAAAAIDPIVGKALSGAVGAGLTGGDIGRGALTGGIGGGLDWLGGSLMSNLPKGLPTRLGVSAGLGGLGALLQGGKFSGGALSGLVGGGLGALGNYATRNLGVNPQLSGALSQMGTRALSDKLGGRNTDWTQLAINTALRNARPLPSNSRYAEKK